MAATDTDSVISTGCERCLAAARSRVAAAEQLALLSAENDALGEQVYALQREVEALRTRLAAGAPDAPAAAAATSGGDDDTCTQEDASAALHALSVLDDVTTEGDGAIPTTCAAEGTPHGAANIVSTATLPVAGWPTVVISGGADRRLVASVIDQPGADDCGACRQLGAITLPAPALCLAPCPARLTVGNQPAGSCVHGLLACGLMDGRTALVRWRLTLPSDASSGMAIEWEAGAVPPLSPLLLGLHSKYVTRVGWSPCGRFLATGSHDRSLALLRVEHSAEALQATVRVTKLQQCYFSGPVEALAWAWTPVPTHPSLVGPPSVTLVAASRGSPTLHYLTLMHIDSSASGSGATTREAAAAAAAGLAAGQWLPLLTSSLASGSGTLHLLMHRLPLSEDGLSGSMFLAGTAAADSLGQGRLSLQAAEEGGAREGVSCVAARRAGLASSLASDGQATSVFASAGFPGGGSPFNSAAERGCGAPGASGAGDALGAPGVGGGGDVTEGGRYIPVGFAVVDLAVPLQPLAPPARSIGDAPSGPLLLAACGDNGVVYVYRFGHNAVRSRLVGHVVGTALGAPTRITWIPPRTQDGGAPGTGSCTAQPHYLAATSERDYAVVVYSTASGKPVARLGLGQPIPGGYLAATEAGGAAGGSAADAARSSRYGGNVRALQAGGGSHLQSRGHAASIKDIAAVPSTAPGKPPALVTVGFDKKLLVWQ